MKISSIKEQSYSFRYSSLNVLIFNQSNLFLERTNHAHYSLWYLLNFGFLQSLVHCVLPLMFDDFDAIQTEVSIIDWMHFQFKLSEMKDIHYYYACVEIFLSFEIKNKMCFASIYRSNTFLPIAMLGFFLVPY